MQKSPTNIWKFKNNVLSLHRFSPQKYEVCGTKVLGNIFEKTFQKIWWFQKYALPLHHFPLRKKWSVKIGMVL